MTGKGSQAERVERLPIWAWIVAGLAAVGGGALALGKPGTLAFWLSPLLIVPLLGCIGARVLSPWSAIPATRRVLAGAIAGVLVVAAALVAVLWQSERGFLLAGILLLPLLTVLAMREADDANKRTTWDDPTLDVPDFPGE